eukprot:220373_1
MVIWVLIWMNFNISTHRSTQQNSKQSKKWRLPSRKYKSKRDREKRHNVSLDLDITDPARTMKSPVMSWNCHRKLENIKKKIKEIDEKMYKQLTEKNDNQLKEEKNDIELTECTVREMVH